LQCHFGGPRFVSHSIPRFPIFGTPFAFLVSRNRRVAGDKLRAQLEDPMVTALASIVIAAIGGAAITYLLTGSLGLAVLVFIVLKLIGR
jgi:hypothetical protein